MVHNVQVWLVDVQSACRIRVSRPSARTLRCSLIKIPIILMQTTSSTGRILRFMAPLTICAVVVMFTTTDVPSLTKAVQLKARQVRMSSRLLTLMPATSLAMCSTTVPSRTMLPASAWVVHGVAILPLYGSTPRLTSPTKL